MKIEQIETYEVVIPMIEPLVFSPYTQDAGNYVLVKVITDSGIVGIGESSCPFNHSSAIKAIADSELKQLMIGEDPTRIEYLVDKMESVIRPYYKKDGVFAMSGLEMALWDITGKLYGVPLYMLLGGCYRDSVQFLGYLFIRDPDENADIAERYVQNGLTTLKLKVGLDIDQDIATLDRIRMKVDESIEIRIDANQAWRVTEAIRNIRRMERFKISSVEQPVAAWDLEGMAEVRRAINIPIVADESCFTVEDALQIVQHRAADIFLVRIEEAGGITNTKKLTAIAEAAGIPCIMGTWNDSEIGIMAKVSVVASSRNFPYANDTVLHYFDQGVTKKRVNLVGSAVRLPCTPGIGVEIDDEKLARFCKNS